MSRSIRSIAAVAALACALVLTGAAPVAANGPTDATIVSHMDFNPDGFNHGTFEASGPAVDQGLICASGTVDDTRLIFAGFRSGRGAQIPVRKTFTCPDGELFIKIQVHLDFGTSTETFSWVVLGGTGVYGGVEGSGQGTTVGDGSDPQTGNFNTYTGFLLS
jgi:hypothetical protein